MVRVILNHIMFAACLCVL